MKYSPGDEDSADEADEDVLSKDEGGTDVDGVFDGADSLGTSPHIITFTLSTFTGSVAILGVISNTTLLPSSLMGINSLGSPATLTTCNNTHVLKVCRLYKNRRPSDVHYSDVN